MDTLEKVGYALLGGVAAVYLIAMIIGMIAVFPFGLIGFVVLTALGLLFVKVLKERLGNREDDYYSKEVDK